MVRHFETKKEAIIFRDGQNSNQFGWLKVYKKVKGQKNRIKKPFVVCTEIEWLNLY